MRDHTLKNTALIHGWLVACELAFSAQMLRTGEGITWTNILIVDVSPPQSIFTGELNSPHDSYLGLAAKLSSHQHA
jgi:hypothetical protein